MMTRSVGSRPRRHGDWSCGDVVMEAGWQRQVPRRPGGVGMVAAMGPKAAATLGVDVQAGAVAGRRGGASAAGARGTCREWWRAHVARVGI
jgi:hypothetical protein